MSFSLINKLFHYRVNFAVGLTVILQLFCALSIGSFFYYFFQDNLYFSADLHKACLSLAPISSYRDYYQAIVCGHKLPHSSTESLKQLGLAHIIVVSGAHLVFLSKTFHWLPKNRFFSSLQFLFLFTFISACQFQAPAFRAGAFLLILFINKKWKLFNSASFCILLSLLLTMSSFPQLYKSLSLCLSWLAALAIHQGKNLFSQSFYCYLFILPVLSNFQTLHPWSIVINSFFTPLLCMILFPLCFLSFFVSPLSFITDSLWRALFLIAEQLSPSMTMNSLPLSFKQGLSVWLYPLSINLLMIYRTHRKK